MANDYLLKPSDPFKPSDHSYTHQLSKSLSTAALHQNLAKDRSLKLAKDYIYSEPRQSSHHDLKSNNFYKTDEVYKTSKHQV